MTSLLSWDETDDRAVAYLRALAADAVQKVGNGHPGTAMSLAPVAYLLFTRVMTFDPRDPSWLGRDRFVLSAGHSSLTLYLQLYLADMGLAMQDLQAFRTWGSRTPGHPEFGHTPGVETTTGPLGQGLATAVGMAMGARYERGILDPSSPRSPFDHHVFVLASDGDLEEGISGEASSLAGTQALGALTVIWDDNRISIEGDTAVAFTEDVVARYRAYGWDVHEVEQLPSGDVDVAALQAAIEDARTVTDKPSFIRVRTTIAWPAPTASGTAKSHGSALGSEEVAATKVALGLNPGENFAFDSAVLADVRSRLHARLQPLIDAWHELFDSWRRTQPSGVELLTRLESHALPAGIDTALPTYQPGTSVATRKASGDAINALAPRLPELWGGSADLAESNNTSIEKGGSFLPVSSKVPGADPYGRIVHFGVREHAMGAIVNGAALGGLLRPYAGTFLVFSDYMRGAVRLAALMGCPSTFVWTHDSIGLGEDGPTHQPIEHLWSLRAIPGFAVIRPADGNETSAAWSAILHQRGPVGLVLTRQNVPTITDPAHAHDGVRRGAYVLEGPDSPDAIIIATGSEVALAVSAAHSLRADGISVRVVSAPCLEWFDEQDPGYRDHVLPPAVRARVAVEAGATLGWWKYVGGDGDVIGIDHFGASADHATLFREFGITAERVAGAVRATLVGR
ncbi:MAG: transketolase [Actinomycetota bacterium]